MITPSRALHILYRHVGQRGNALIGALTATAVAGTVGAALISSYDAYVRQSRIVYARTVMSALDAKIRFMATQPQAYVCGSEHARGNLEGLECDIRPGYFASVDHTPFPGAKCPATTPNCGFRLVISGPNEMPGAPAYGYRHANVVNPVTNDVEEMGVLNYQLVYEGTDFGLQPTGNDLYNGARFGMLLSRDILQSDEVNCAQINPRQPVFQGLGPNGQPRCAGFTPCPAGQQAVGVDVPNMRMTCRPFGKNVRCTDRSPTYMLYSLDWRGAGAGGNELVENCYEIPTAPVPYIVADTLEPGNLPDPTTPPPPAPTPTPTPPPPPPPPPPIAGVCGASNGATLESAPATDLCAVGAASAVDGAGPWSWTCAGSNGGGTASCSAAQAPRQGRWALSMFPGFMACPYPHYMMNGAACPTIGQICGVSVLGGTGSVSIRYYVCQ